MCILLAPQDGRATGWLLGNSRRLEDTNMISEGIQIDLNARLGWEAGEEK